MIPAAVFAAILAVGLAAGGSDGDRLAHSDDAMGSVSQMRRVAAVRNTVPDAPELPRGIPRADGNGDSRTVLRIPFLVADGTAEPYAPEPVAELTPEPPPVKEVPVYQPNVERWRGLVASVFPEWAVDTVLRIMDCESEGLPEATGRLGERGLLQIHPIHHDSTYDPLGNLWAAYRISRGVSSMIEPMTDERPSCLCSCTPEIDRLRAELAAREAECERLLRENLELKMRPVFDEYRP